MLVLLLFTGCQRVTPKTVIDIYSVAVGFRGRGKKTIKSGIEVSQFFNGIPISYTNDYDGVLFQVVSPPKFAGQYFWMMHDGYLSAGDASAIYNPESVYKFAMVIGVARKDFDDIEYIRKLVCERDLFCLPKNGYYLNTLRPVGERVFANEGEVAAEINRIRENIDKTISGMNEQAYLEKFDFLHKMKSLGKTNELAKILKLNLDADKHYIEKLETRLRELDKLSQSGELEKQYKVISGIIATNYENGCETHHKGSENVR